MPWFSLGVLWLVVFVHGLAGSDSIWYIVFGTGALELAGTSAVRG